MFVKVINPFYNKLNLEEYFEKGTLLKVNDEERYLNLIYNDLVVDSKEEKEYIELDPIVTKGTKEDKKEKVVGEVKEKEKKKVSKKETKKQ